MLIDKAIVFRNPEKGKRIPPTAVESEKLGKSQNESACQKYEIFLKWRPTLRFRSSFFTNSTIQLSKRANWAGYEIATSPRDGR